MKSDFLTWRRFVANADAPRQHITSKSHLNNLLINSAIIFGQNRFQSRPQLCGIADSDSHISMIECCFFYNFLIEIRFNFAD